MHFIGLFSLFSGLTPALIIHENVAFHKANEIALTRSKYLFTFIIDLKPYETSYIGVRIEQFFDYPSKQDYRRIIQGLKGKIVAILNHQYTLVENYIELHVIHAEMKRSLIPIIGKGISYLFGTVMESDLNTTLKC